LIRRRRGRKQEFLATRKSACGAGSRMRVGGGGGGCSRDHGGVGRRSHSSNSLNTSPGHWSRGSSMTSRPEAIHWLRHSRVIAVRRCSTLGCPGAHDLAGPGVAALRGTEPSCVLRHPESVTKILVSGDSRRHGAQLRVDLATNVRTQEVMQRLVREHFVDEGFVVGVKIGQRVLDDPVTAEPKVGLVIDASGPLQLLISSRAKMNNRWRSTSANSMTSASSVYIQSAKTRERRAKVLGSDRVVCIQFVESIRRRVEQRVELATQYFGHRRFPGTGERVEQLGGGASRGNANVVSLGQPRESRLAEATKHAALAGDRHRAREGTSRSFAKVGRALRGRRSSALGREIQPKSGNSLGLRFG
jgi:hypothetical protein